MWATALTGAFVGLARLFVLWDPHARAASGPWRVQEPAWMYLGLAGLVAFGLLAALHGLTVRGARTAGLAAGVLYAGTLTLTHGWSERTADQILRDRGVAYPAVVTEVRPRADGRPGEVRRARLADGRVLTLAGPPAPLRGAARPREHPVGAETLVTLDPAGAARPRLGPPPTGAAVGRAAAGAAAVAAGSLAAAVPLGARTAIRRAERRRPADAAYATSTPYSLSRASRPPR
ncbi:hypothetical protein ACGFXC_28190 [Streptomyces sp. NPDC048507]|uniref:hypothetical protein n=1 Tax=Streptomyces sp. NPDC048507 TaxID=3365560 RepID=UPI003712E180